MVVFFRPRLVRGKAVVGSRLSVVSLGKVRVRQEADVSPYKGVFCDKSLRIEEAASKSRGKYR